MATDNLPSTIEDIPCCGISHRVTFLTADRTGASGARTHDIEVYPRFVQGYISLVPELIEVATAASWEPNEKALYTRTSTVNTFTLTGITDAANITLVTVNAGGSVALALTSVVGNVITVQLATTAGVITTTWDALATFLNAQPTVAAIVTAAAMGADIGTLLFTAGTVVAYPGDQTAKSSYTLTHSSNSLILESAVAGAVVTVNLAGGTSQTLAVSSVSGNTINIQLGTNGSGVSTSSIDDVVDLINNDVGASAVAVASASGAATDTTLVLATDDFLTIFPLVARTKGLTIKIQDDAFTDISPALTATITGGTVANGQSLTSAVFAISPTNTEWVDADGRISVTKLIAVARAAVPDLTKIILHISNANSPVGYQFNALGWEWHAG